MRNCFIFNTVVCAVAASVPFFGDHYKDSRVRVRVWIKVRVMLDPLEPYGLEYSTSGYVGTIRALS